MGRHRLITSIRRRYSLAAGSYVVLPYTETPGKPTEFEVSAYSRHAAVTLTAI